MRRSIGFGMLSMTENPSKVNRTFRTLGGTVRTWTPEAYDGAVALIRTLCDVPFGDRMDALALAVFVACDRRAPGTVR